MGSSLEMMVIDVKEAAGECIDVYGVDADGRSVLLRVTGFRNHFWVPLRLTSPPPDSAVATIRAALVAALGADGGGKGSGKGLDESTLQSQLRLDGVERTPLLACYRQVEASLAASNGARAELPPVSGGRRVPMLRVEHGPLLKPKELLEALGRAAQKAEVGALLAPRGADGKVAGLEDSLSPAGSSSLLRRFAIERQLGGGVWLVAEGAAPASLGSRCTLEARCAHDAVHGKAPDILAEAEKEGEAERWARLPRLSTLAVRVATSRGYTEPQWEAGEATADGVRLIACEWTREGGSAPDSNLLVFAHAAGGPCVRRLPARDGCVGGRAVELRLYPDEATMLVGFEEFVTTESDPDVLLTYDARCIGLLAERHACLLGAGSKPKPKAKAKPAAEASRPPLSLGREPGAETKVVRIVTYSKAWVKAGTRQQTSENLETHEVTGCAGRFSLDVLRALVCHQKHKLTTYSFAQAVEAVLGEPTELVLPQVLAAAPLERVALHAAQQARQLSRMAHGLKSLEETVEMARLTSLPLRTITNQAQMVRTENLLLRAARTLGYTLPLGSLPEEMRWPSSLVPPDATAYQHWPWARKALDGQQRHSIDIGVAGHCCRNGEDGSAGAQRALRRALLLTYSESQTSTPPGRAARGPGCRPGFCLSVPLVLHRP
jgi:hypothetical protein